MNKYRHEFLTKIATFNATWCILYLLSEFEMERLGGISDSDTTFRYGLIRIVKLT